jgi:ornithine decarboxylase antizyme 1
VRGLGGVPDVPQSALVSCILVEEQEGSSGGGLGVAKGKFKAVTSVGELNGLSCSGAIRLSLNVASSEQQHVQWEAILWKENLFILIPTGVTLDNSKQAFISLLELAEEELGCKQVTVYFNKDRNDRNVLVRLFAFLGFTMLPPNHSIAPTNASEELLFMAYSINA